MAKKKASKKRASKKTSKKKSSKRASAKTAKTHWMPFGKRMAGESHFSKNPGALMGGGDVELSDEEQELLVYLDDLDRRDVYRDKVIRKAMLTGKPYFDYGVTFSRTTPESVEDGDFSETGWEADHTEGTLDDVLNAASRYYIQPRDRGDGTDWWESYWDVTSYRTGEEEQHSLHVNLIGKTYAERQLPSHVFDFINIALGGKPRANPYVGDAVQSATARNKKKREKERQQKYGYPALKNPSVKQASRALGEARYEAGLAELLAEATDLHPDSAEALPDIFAEGFNSGWGAYENVDVEPGEDRRAAAWEAEQNSRDYSPFEHLAYRINNLDDNDEGDSETGWAVYERGVEAGIQTAIEVERLERRAKKSNRNPTTGSGGSVARVSNPRNY